jgi:hypothetical protein
MSHTDTRGDLGREGADPCEDSCSTKTSSETRPDVSGELVLVDWPRPRRGHGYGRMQADTRRRSDPDGEAA